MNAESLYIRLDNMHEQLEGTSAYQEKTKRVLEIVLEALNRCIEGEVNPKRKEVILRGLRRFERHALDAHGASKLARMEQKFSQWQDKVREEF